MQIINLTISSVTKLALKSYFFHSQLRFISPLRAISNIFNLILFVIELKI